jgi:hypothetical protein
MEIFFFINVQWACRNRVNQPFPALVCRRQAIHPRPCGEYVGKRFEVKLGNLTENERKEFVEKLDYSYAGPRGLQRLAA